MTARRSKQSLPQEISPGYSLEGLRLKRQYLGHLMQRAHSLEKTLMLGKIEGRREGVAMGETLGWHHGLDRHEFEQIVRQWRTEEPGALLPTGSQRRTELSNQTTTADRGPGASLVAQTVKNRPAMQETQTRSPGREELLEKRVAAHSRTLVWRIPRTEKPGGLWSVGLQRVRHD